MGLMESSPHWFQIDEAMRTIIVKSVTLLPTGTAIRPDQAFPRQKSMALALPRYADHLKL